MKHFGYHEFDSPDKPGSGKRMQASTLEKLDRAREIAGIPFRINSGYRTRAHNRKVGGVNTSSHLEGFAADIDISGVDSRERFLIVSACIVAGFTRIGVGSGFIHVDDDPGKPPKVLWLY